MFDLNIRFQIAAIVIFLVVIIDYCRNKHLKMLSTRCFIGILLLTGIHLCFDVASVYCVTHTINIPYETNRAIHRGFMGSMILLIYLFYLYVDLFAKGQIRLVFKEAAISLIPLAFSTFMLFKGKLYFMVRGNHAYSYGSMAVGVYVCALIYLIRILQITYNTERKLTRHQRISIRIGLAFWTVFFLIQFLYPYILISSVGIIALELCLYLSFESQKENYDALTDTFNKNAFDLMSVEISHKDKKPVLINISWNNMKYFANIFGYTDSNEGLGVLKGALSSVFCGYIYRTRNNTFSIFLRKMPKKEKIEQLEAILKTLKHRGIGMRCVVSVIDLNVYAKNDDDIHSLLSFAYHKLSDWETGVYYISQDMVDGKRRQEKIELMINDGLKNDGFEMFYQPIYSTKDKQFHSAEALLRMKDTTTIGFVSPEVFIPIAEDKGMIEELSDRVFELVARDIDECKMKEHGMKYMEVNLSRIQTVTPDIAAHLHSIFAAKGIDNSFINVEITETASVGSMKVLNRNIEELKSAGFSLSMDDFGTGYSNLAQINQVRYDMIKLDKSIIWPAFDEKLSEEQRETSMRLLESTIHMMKAMGAEIVAEGVETKEMVDYLTQQGVDYLQGYYYSKPVNREMFIEFVKNNAFV